MRAPLRTLLALLLGSLAALTAAAAPSQAVEPTVTRFPVTDVIINSCNDELVLFNATLVVQTRLSAKGGRMTYSEQTWLEDASAASEQQSYNVVSSTFDRFSTSVTKKQSTMRSFQRSRLQLSPSNGEAGTLTVSFAYGFASDLNTGETKILNEESSATCS